MNKEKIPYYEDNTRVSRSSLNWFKLSPKYFKDRLDGKVSNESTAAMENGTMVHMYILQPDEFKKSYKILDFETPSSAQQKKFCQDYIDSNAEKPILKASEAFKLNYSATSKKEEDIAAKGLEMALKLKSYIKWLRGNKNGVKTMTWSKLNSLKVIRENVLLHKKAKELLLNTQENSPEFEAHNEFHINWEYPVKDGRIVSCKSLIDRIEIDHENKVIRLIDIKTTVSASNFKESFDKYDYGMQMAFYWMAIYWYFTNELKINVEEYRNETYIVAIDNISSDIKVFSIDDSIILQKATEVDQILSEIDWHFKSNQWDYTRAYYEGDGSEPLFYDIT